MDKEKWMLFIQQLWATIGYWQLVKLYRENVLPGSFFQFTAFALRDKLFLLLANTVQVCDEIAQNHDIGDKAKATLEEINALYCRGEGEPRSRTLNYEDCGIKPYRDKVLAHPAAFIKELLGKEPFKISLRWETVEQTLEKIKQFADEVEAHYLPTWDITTFNARLESSSDFGAS